MKISIRNFKVQNAYRIIFILSLVEIIAMLVCSSWQVFDNTDVRSNIETYDFIKNDIPDLLRTPLYTGFVGWLQDVSGRLTGRIIVLVINIGLFFWSLIVFRKVCNMLLRNRILTCILVGIYALWPSVPAIVCELSAEGIVCSITVFIIWLTLNDLRNSSVKRAVAIAMLCIFVVVLKPICLYLLALYPLGYFITGLVKRRFGPAVANISVCLMGVMLIFQSSILTEYRYEMRMISLVYDINNYFTLRTIGCLKPEDVVKPEISKQLEEITVKTPVFTGETGYEEILSIMAVSSPKEFHEFITSVMGKHKKEISVHIINQAYVMSKSRLNYLNMKNPLSYLFAPFCLNFGTFFLIMVIVALLGIKQWYVDRKVPLETLFLWFFAFSYIIAIMAGAMNDWEILILSVQSVGLLLIGLILNRFSLKQNALLA